MEKVSVTTIHYASRDDLIRKLPVSDFFWKRLITKNFDKKPSTKTILTLSVSQNENVQRVLTFRAYSPHTPLAYKISMMDTIISIFLPAFL